jgi:ABC-type polysaccharide/polyol phosphate transport system ATPase subunit
MKNRLKRIVLALCVVTNLSGWNAMSVSAKNASVTFGSEAYEEQENSKFPIGVYIESDEKIGKYHIELKYDTARMKYMTGGDEEADGVIVLDGTGLSSRIKYMLSFETVTGGPASIEVVNATIENDEGVKQQVSDQKAKAKITIAGPDETGDTVEEAPKQVKSDDVKVPKSKLESKSDKQMKSRGVLASITYAVLGNDWASYVLLGLAALSLLLIVAIANIKFSQKRKHKKHIERKKEHAEAVRRREIAIQQAQESGDEERLKTILEEKEPIISVQNVTMRFKVATKSVSGIKDYFIQRIKGELSYRDFTALDHINFDVYKGEVMGIIGTNGSGKSTLLKIVSGALNPTEGRVKVDRRKVQLLTLGTGFDMELTARENVYLNGAIIGYSRAFLDEHYDEIVKFAELEGFMEEKVKNFSSGMVSRLCFAIATAGDAAEILILDEVLSVGDEFFRKKSLKRVKEMIHGGSTVLLVSHGMGTILDNCSRVVWIEKGEMKMIGDPKTVCHAYREMGAANV